MRHAVDGRKFGRNTSHRVAMLRNLANSIIEKEQVITTVQKAKEARRVVERLITLAKKNTIHARRLAFDRTRDEAVVAKLFSVLSQRYEKRPGGYTRVLKLSDRRKGDSAEMALVELVDHPPIDRKRKKKEPAAEGDQNSENKGVQEAAAPSDPFSRFRKIFSGKRSKQAPEGTKVKSPAKTVARRSKTMAGTSGNKSGGSSGS